MKTLCEAPVQVVEGSADGAMEARLIERETVAFLDPAIGISEHGKGPGRSRIRPKQPRDRFWELLLDGDEAV